MSDEVVERLVSAGVYDSVEDAVADDVNPARRRWRASALIANAILAGYERHPQSDTDVALGGDVGLRSIAVQPW